MKHSITNKALCLYFNKQFIVDSLISWQTENKTAIISAIEQTKFCFRLLQCQDLMLLCMWTINLYMKQIFNSCNHVNAFTHIHVTRFNVSSLSLTRKLVSSRDHIKKKKNRQNAGTLVDNQQTRGRSNKPKQHVQTIHSLDGRDEGNLTTDLKFKL